MDKDSTPWLYSDAPDLVTAARVLESKDDFLGAEVIGPEEPGRSRFTTIDAYFIATSRNKMRKLLAAVETLEWYENQNQYAHTGENGVVRILEDRGHRAREALTALEAED